MSPHYCSLFFFSFCYECNIKYFNIYLIHILDVSTIPFKHDGTADQQMIMKINVFFFLSVRKKKEKKKMCVLTKRGCVWHKRSTVQIHGYHHTWDQTHRYQVLEAFVHACGAISSDFSIRQKLCYMFQILFNDSIRLPGSFDDWLSVVPCSSSSSSEPLHPPALIAGMSTVIPTSSNGVLGHSNRVRVPGADEEDGRVSLSSSSAAHRGEAA